MEAIKTNLSLPSIIPVLPVRNTVLFPNTAVPLIIGRQKSIRAIQEAQKQGDVILVVAQQDGSQDEPTHADLYRIGVVCMVSKVNRVDSDGYQLIANGLFRFQVSDFIDQEGFLGAIGSPLEELPVANQGVVDSLARELKQLGKSILTLSSLPGVDAIVKLFNQLEDPEHLSDLCCTFLQLAVSFKQEMLEVADLDTRLKKVIEQMVTEKERLLLQNEMQSKMMERISKDQRDHLLREQLRTIHEELGDESQTTADFATKIEQLDLPDEVRKVANEELSRLALVQRSSPEYHVIRTYLDWIVALPWNKVSAPEPKTISLEEASAILNVEHFGIEKVKRRILQHLAVTKLKGDLKGSILCLVGPPGVGKTSIAKSIASALGRQFIRVSLGGVRDEAEIRGHRRTYIGALPGRLIQSLKRAQAKDPLILLDEIDKVGTDFRGDPASALLEVLDPEQNHAFMDHYLDVGFDLSKAFFITTANVVETIPPALRDRLEIIEMTSYSNTEKSEIATRHLLPKLLSEHGIEENLFTLDSEMMELIIENYTREAGVRTLGRHIAHLCRAAAERLTSEKPPDRVVVTSEWIEEVLGPQKYFAEAVVDRQRPGVVTGLAWTPVGGEILHIETTQMEGKGNLILTGQLGDVMKESAQIGLSLLRSRWPQTAGVAFEKLDFHIHVPSGAIPKDGPSAGVAIMLCLASLLGKRDVSSKLAVTGELTLRGSVLPVGGIKEKVLAAHRAGIEAVILPTRNRGDLKDVSQDVQKQMRFHFVDTVEEVMMLAGLEPLTALPVVSVPRREESAATYSSH